MDDFTKNNAICIKKMGSDHELKELTRSWFEASSRYDYSYHFTWMGLPVIQFPQDILAVQEIVWKVKPDLIVETGVARGGSIVFLASLQELIGKNGKVLGIDIDIRKPNRIAIESHPMFHRIELLEGSSIDSDVVSAVKTRSLGKKTLVLLDSNHTHDHVLEELKLYTPFVSKGSYVVVFDTIIEDMPEDFSSDRPWGRGNNPKTAVRQFLKTTDRFEIDREIENKLLITVAPEGYLKCLKD